MQITTISAKRLINTGNYENTTFEAAAALAPGEDPQACMHALQVMLVGMAARELIRRYPDPADRKYRMWTEEDERAELAQQ